MLTQASTARRRTESWKYVSLVSLILSSWIARKGFVSEVAWNVTRMWKDCDNVKRSSLTLPTCSSCARLTNIGTRSLLRLSTSTTLAKSPSLPLAALEELTCELNCTSQLFSHLLTMGVSSWQRFLNSVLSSALTGADTLKWDSRYDLENTLATFQQHSQVGRLWCYVSKITFDSSRQRGRMRMSLMWTSLRPPASWPGARSGTLGPPWCAAPPRSSGSPRPCPSQWSPPQWPDSPGEAADSEHAPEIRVKVK